MRKLFRVGPLALIVIFLGVIGFSYYRIIRERHVLLDDLDRRARVIARSLAPGAIRAIRNPPTPDEEDLAERLSGMGRTMGILLCNPKGEVVARSAALADIANCGDKDIEAALSSTEEKVYFGEERGRSLHRLIYPLKTRTGEFVGALAVFHEASYIAERVRSAITWTTLTLALLALIISSATYLFSRRSFERSVEQFLSWMRSHPEVEEPRRPTESLLKPVAREIERLSARLRAARETVQEVSAARQVAELWTSARLKAHAVTHLGNRPLIAVSNREPYMHTKEYGKRRVIIPASGLVTALDPILRATSGLWVAHGAGDADRDVVDKENKVLVPPGAATYTLKRVWLNKREEEGYYYGFSNEALWPLCHLTHHRPSFEEKDWIEYSRVNDKFSDAVASEFGQDCPIVLVQDYHFTLLPQKLRRHRPDAVIGLFWHIPWPTPEGFQVCPWKREILLGMLGSNLIGFHLQSYCNNFLDTVNNLLPVRIDWDRSAVVHEGGTTVVKPIPISIQPWGERRISSDEEFHRRETTLREELEFKEARLVVSVDRIDYTKGIPERLGAIDQFFEKYPHFKGKVSFVQLAAPSRMHIPKYRELIREIEELTDRINWHHAGNGWKPIVLLKAHHDPTAVYTFLRMADICIVSSLQDGMNLVAKEFVAARDRGDGVLILSEFTGAARELQEALHVNPYAKTDFAETIRIALEMPPVEQERRMTRLKAIVAERNVYQWAAQLIQEMASAAESMPLQKVTGTLGK